MNERLHVGDLVCIAGKNDIAVECLELIIGMGWPAESICVVLNKDDTGRSTWQKSLGFYARKNGIRIAELEEVKAMREVWFFSVEFDRILRPREFASSQLFNVHFSKLPAYRGVSTSVWPILRGEKESGVTFHRIDAGIDTGPIIHQRAFAIGGDWTARDLYFNYLSEGVSLFRESIQLLLSGEAREVPQDESAASLFRRRDIDFKAIKIDLEGSVRQVLAQLRAYAFWEYQLPIVFGRKVWSAHLLNSSPTAARGTIRERDEWKSTLSLYDGDIEIHYSPYEDLFDWALGLKPTFSDLSVVPDLDLQDSQGWSALMKAAHVGNVAAIRSLISAGASPNSSNRRGTTPLMYAFSHMINTGDDTAVRTLLDLGSDPRARDQHGKSIRDYIPTEHFNKIRESFPSLVS